MLYSNFICLDEIHNPNLAEQIIRKIYIAAKNCYSPDISTVINKFSKSDTPTIDEMSNYIIRIINSGHLSVIEHAELSFQFFGISRSCSHQIVRHRIAAYSQQSLRYTDADNANFLIPESIQQNEKALELYLKTINNTMETYSALKEMDIPKEDARNIIPTGIKTSIVVTYNLRQWKHFFNERCCTKAQNEIRENAWDILDYLCNLLPGIFDKNNDGPKCVKLKYCPESKSCGYINQLKKDKNNI